MSCCICNPQLKPNPDLCPRHKEQAILTAIETNIRISEAADGMYWDAKEKIVMPLIHCCACGEAKPHFTAVDDGRMGYYCDDCVIAGELAFIGVTIPDVPGVPQKSRESIVPQDLASPSPAPRIQ